VAHGLATDKMSVVQKSDQCLALIGFLRRIRDAADGFATDKMSVVQESVIPSRPIRDPDLAGYFTRCHVTHFAIDDDGNRASLFT